MQSDSICVKPFSDDLVHLHNPGILECNWLSHARERYMQKSILTPETEAIQHGV